MIGEWFWMAIFHSSYTPGYVSTLPFYVVLMILSCQHVQICTAIFEFRFFNPLETIYSIWWDLCLILKSAFFLCIAQILNILNIIRIDAQKKHTSSCKLFGWTHGTVRKRTRNWIEKRFNQLKEYEITEVILLGYEKDMETKVAKNWAGERQRKIAITKRAKSK